MEFNIITLPVGQMQSNCYLLIAENRDCLIVDPGDDGDYLERIIADHRAKPLTILATHGHFDHIMAVTELKLAYNIPFLINQKDEFLVKNMRQSAGHFLGIQTDPPPDADNFLQENEIIALGGHKIRVIGTPGHTPGSVCLYLEKEKCLISGDTLFAGGGVGRTDFSYSSPTDLAKSLEIIFALPADTEIKPGHGEASTLKKEKKRHDFFLT
ncbi:MAG: metallo-beta-lactamase family protein [Candidatus Gottesmanbacteria bacterium GW2011_GWA2_43_14]|uniref:Metallo-beta-lactamase family protein n=1 Tax=Candidatus Gottesmanbacteria bacterium GW2011_GWA2_43_14 TaxID=1618443 RepID=A0A0G1FU57_9BACT|nr:MAG: metallo-beta-lactamase family protein [Candidatus Gottesmanbacteria bacterium GW2011_GWA2_43_14]